MKPRLLQVYVIMSTLVIGLVKRTAAVCGHPTFSQRVVGGNNSVLGKWPWQVSVMYGNIHMCGGSLISRRWVVTAAHCMSSENLPTSTVRKRRMSSDNYQGSTGRRHHQKRLVTGDFYVMMGMLSLTGGNNTTIIVPATNIIINPMYNGDGTSGDLALLELSSLVTFNNNIQPICLPSLNQVFPDGMMCWLTGWGDTVEGVKLASPYTLQEVELPLINSTTCDNMLKAANNITSTVTIVQDDMICAGYSEGKKDGCQGDSGGPLACQLGNFWFLVGIVSWGVGCGRPGEPGVYTKVSNFSAWIQQNSGLAATTTNTLSKKPPPTTQSFSLPIDIRNYNQAGQRPHMAATYLLFLMLLLRALDIM